MQMVQVLSTLVIYSLRGDNHQVTYKINRTYPLGILYSLTWDHTFFWILFFSILFFCAVETLVLDFYYAYGISIKRGEGSVTSELGRLVYGSLVYRIRAYRLHQFHRLLHLDSI